MIPVNRPEFGIMDLVAFFRGYYKDALLTLEQTFAKYIGVDYSVFTSSGRSALYLAYKSLKLKGEVIVSPLTCSEAISPIIYSGLKPHFVDIDIDNYNIDPEKIKEAITRNTCAIQVIHLAGNPCEMKTIGDLAEDNNLLLIEDCAQSLGAKYEEKITGSFGKISCFSLMKNMFGIGGGTLCTNSLEISLNVRDIQNKFNKLSPQFKYYRLFKVYIDKSRGTFFGDFIYNIFYHIRSKILEESGDCSDVQNVLQDTRLFNNPTNIEASVLLSQFKSLNKHLKRRIENASVLTKEIRNYSDIKIQKTTNNSKHVFTKYMIETDYPSINMITKLRNYGIDAMHLRQAYRALYQERFDKDPLYSHFDYLQTCKKYLNVHDHIISLPISSNMTNKELKYIAKQVGKIVEGHK